MNNKMLIVTHGSLGNTLIEVAKQIIGEIRDEAITSISNEDFSTAELTERIRMIVDKDPDSFFIIATDFPGGSCFIASKKIASSSKRISSVSGLNISMVLSFLTKRELYRGIQLTETIKTDGNRAIVS
jgi:PTS system mannose-specific IIA component